MDSGLHARLLGRAEAIRRRELGTACRRLEAKSEPIDPHVREVLDRLSRSLIEGLLPDVRRGLEAADRDDVQSRAEPRHVGDLFDLSPAVDDPTRPTATELAVDEARGASSTSG